MPHLEPEEKLPRFILTVTDTQTTVSGPHGDQHMSISIGADSLAEFTKRIPKHKRKNAGHNEVQAMLVFFAEQVDKSNIERKPGETKHYEQVEIKDNDEQE